ncbi:ABC transporter ATP-binding protein [Helcobacillus massiliensis]|uniref:ABC transporter ATP-binding protein n=1 Tax=Helcobacillus TaxID=1161125 RepID=UPI001EF74EA8|nr:MULTISPECIES: ABC transporter ATP-binding protein [Helcobacillus]MCG7427879.1 ABC transporter ATP-binding protein [Helcobacillus sp. ACRRO]MCT1557597.1 ABC transporter ATP-binding protein [Helcobacillus massiliensis]MCT2037161.1 ABC transporter ATP-binding protein [Helcobacillus massiliensis]MCT2332425.1 ABC transporter ATP-binding protein [Helcobacillus massiliensis]MDK7742624.1 ABC transporter ATP-binding protein [Helcobacillus massiliensis]
MTSVSLTDITKDYGSGIPSVSSLSIDIADGEFFTLLGPSGCGKSTTLRMIAGFISPSSGQIRFGDRDVTRVAPHKRDTGMVFQNYALFPHMNVAANVGYGLTTRRIRGEEKRRRVAEALEVVGLSDYADRGIGQLSGGQQQRVALARALVIDPSVLLLDEPLSNLDAKLREETRGHIRRIQQESATTSVYVTHDQAEAMAMSDRIAVLKDGVLHQVAQPREIYRCPATAFVARFIGRSNVLGGTVEDVDDRYCTIRLDSGAVIYAPRTARTSGDAPTSGEKIAVSLRPESLSVALVDSSTSPAAGSIRARVTSVEFTGATCLVMTQVGEDEVLASVPDSDSLPQPGDDVDLTPSAEKIWMVKP